MELINNSIFVQNWQISLIISIVILSIINFFIKSKFKKQQQQEQRDNDEEEDEDIDVDMDEYIPSLPELPHIPYKTLQHNNDDDDDDNDDDSGALKFYKMMKNRRSIRSYSTADDDDDGSSTLRSIIEDCIRAAGTSPSGAHTEPWTFCLIHNRKLKTSIRAIIETEERINYEQRMNRQWCADLRPLKTDYQKPYLTDAPYLIVIFKQIYGYTYVDGKHHHRRRRKEHYYNEISVSIATGILICALQSAGLSTVVTTPLNCGPALRQLLKRPMNEKLLVLLPIGYPAEDCQVPDLKRKKLEDILVYYGDR